MRPEAREPIAIVGIGCRFPGGANDPDSFWELLSAGGDSVAEVPPERFDVNAYYDPRPRTPGKLSTRFGGFLEGVERFDAAFFGISPREAERMDPQQRLLLELAWEALEDGGQLSADAASSSLTGVFMGLWLADYEARLLADPGAVDFHMTTGTGRYSASGRLSFALELEGPSLTVDTACSSSLVAVHLACRALWSGDCELALAGGANVILQPQITIAYSQAGMMAADGRCKFGDASADGYVRSEGAGVVALKPLSLALEHGDPIHALIRGSAVGNDGAASGELATPAAAGQEALLRRAWSDAGVRPEQVAYVEAHGTGTRAGDPVELAALGRALASGEARTRRCLVGSVKTNLGHTEGAAGVAGLIKAALVLERATIPASLHVQEPTPDVPWDELDVSLAREPTAWPPEPEAVAGVSSFGIAGTNAHVVLARAPEPSRAGKARREETPLLLPVSARSRPALAASARAYGALLAGEPGFSPVDVCYTASCRRPHHDHRLAVTGTDRADLAAGLRAFLDDERDHRASDDAEAPPRLVFVFPGQGSQYPGMARRLAEREPVVRETLERCEAAMRPFVDWSLAEQLAAEPDAAGYRLDEIDVLQPTLLAVELAIAALWRSWGIEPEAVVGHSLGEVAAAHAAGALSLEDAMRVICTRSRLLRRLSGRGTMALVELSLDEARLELAGREHEVSVASSNGPRTTVIAGDPEALRDVLASLERRGVFCRWIDVDVASHSPQVEPLLSELTTELEDVEPRGGSIPFFSTARGTVTFGEDCNGAYWAENLRRPVLFHEALGRLAADGYDTFLEISPHPILAPAMSEALREAGHEGSVVPSLRREQPELERMVASLGQLYAAGASVDWRALYPDGGRCLRLPRYAWQRERHWLEPAGRHEPSRAGGHPLLGHGLGAADGRRFWEPPLDGELFGGHAVAGRAVLPGAAVVELAVAAAIEAFGPGPSALDDVAFVDGLVFEEPSAPMAQLVVSPEEGGAAGFELFSRRDDDAAWTLHATGRIRRAETEGVPVLARELADWRSRPPEPEGEHLLELAERGLDYGPAFRAVAACSGAPQETVAELRLPDAPGAASHPLAILLDGAFQVAARASRRGAIPLGVERVEVFRAPADEELWCRAIVSAAGDEERADIVVVDRAGDAVLAVRGLRLAPLGADPGAPLQDWLWEPRFAPAERPAASDGGRGAWLVLADAGELAGALADHLEALGGAATVVRGHDGGLERDAREELARADLHGVVDLRSLAAREGADEAAARCDGAIGLVRALAEGDGRAPRLVLVTRGAQAVLPGEAPALTQAAVWGLGAVISNEHPELDCTRVDLAPEAGAAEAAWLAAELAALDAEDGIALRGERRYVARLVRLEPDATARATTHPVSPGEAYGVELRTAGRLDRIELRASEPRPPRPGEVEIAVHAAALNFIDVMKAMGVYPGIDPEREVALGCECAGTVVALGEGVDGLGVGDEVLAVTPSLERTGLLAAFVTVPATLVARKPSCLTLVEAATLPIAFLTADYALDELARVRAGERVLVHSAAGGVGLAAIQVVRRAGAEVVATSRSAEKRDYLRALGIEHVLDSESPSLAEEVLAATGGNGVDVVLGSLAGEARERSLRALAPHGRFVELGKRDIHAGRRISLEPFRVGLSFLHLDLARIVADRPEEVGERLRRIAGLAEQGLLAPLSAESSSIAEAATALRRLSQGANVGKLVLRVAGEEVRVAERRGARPRPDGVYLVTGGLGALGLEVAGRLVDRGARHLLLVGRSEPSAEARTVLDRLRAAGAEVLVARADVASREQLAAAIALTGELPLRGVVHAAGVLDDGLLVDLDDERLRRVMSPKIDGAINLDALTREAPLDFFVLFSSVAGVLGTPGQGGYAAANAALDALALRRRALGLPALSIAWGPWSRVGLAARAGRAERMAARGLRAIVPERGLDALERLLELDAPHLVAAPLDAVRWRASHPGARRASLLAGLGLERPGQSGAPADGGFLDALRAAEPGRDRRELLVRHVRTEVAGVLGISSSKVPARKPFRALGMDSLMTLELRNRLEDRVGLAIPAPAIWNHPTVAALTEHLAGRLGIDAKPVIEPPEGGLERLSTDELQALLAAEVVAAKGLLEGKT